MFAKRPSGKIELITPDGVAIDITHEKWIDVQRVLHVIIKYAIISIPCYFIAKPIAEYLLSIT